MPHWGIRDSLPTAVTETVTKLQASICEEGCWKARLGVRSVISGQVVKCFYVLALIQHWNTWLLRRVPSCCLLGSSCQSLSVAHVSFALMKSLRSSSQPTTAIIIGETLYVVLKCTQIPLQTLVSNVRSRQCENLQQNKNKTKWRGGGVFVIVLGCCFLFLTTEVILICF